MVIGYVPLRDGVDLSHNREYEEYGGKSGEKRAGNKVWRKYGLAEPGHNGKREIPGDYAMDRYDKWHDKCREEHGCPGMDMPLFIGPAPSDRYCIVELLSPARYVAA